jgi:peroxiredoxin Q/BCP
MLEAGFPFPEFSLLDENGNTVTLADLKGQKTVVYFYPKDDTSGCTAEACEFRDTLPTIPGAKVVGVSPDSTKSHRKFADKYGLNFTLLADTEQSLCKAVGVWVEKSMYGKKYMGVERTTFILDADGQVAKVFNKVKPQGHAADVAAALS